MTLLRTPIRSCSGLMGWERALENVKATQSYLLYSFISYLPDFCLSFQAQHNYKCLCQDFLGGQPRVIDHSPSVSSEHFRHASLIAPITLIYGCYVSISPSKIGAQQWPIMCLYLPMVRQYPAQSSVKCVYSK